MRKTISNTTPLLSLLKIRKLDLLQRLYQEIIIPQAVYKEIEAGYDKAYYTDIESHSWIKIENLQFPSSRQLLYDLDDGEAETILLAQEQNADLVIIDEKCGRRYAQQLGLKLTGTIGVLLRAKTEKLIPAISPLLDELRRKNSWLSDSLVDKARTLAGER
jgi:predicted nucleic acid-binding protein